jgi:hypothetical protein
MGESAEGEAMFVDADKSCNHLVFFITTHDCRHNRHSVCAEQDDRGQESVSTDRTTREGTGANAGRSIDRPAPRRSI